MNDESGHTTLWKALDPTKYSICRFAIAPWVSSRFSSIQQPLKVRLLRACQKSHTVHSQVAVLEHQTSFAHIWSVSGSLLLFYSWTQNSCRLVFELNSAVDFDTVQLLKSAWKRATIFFFKSKCKHFPISTSSICRMYRRVVFEIVYMFAWFRGFSSFSGFLIINSTIELPET